MTYHAELAAALRDRKCTEAQVLDALRDVEQISFAGSSAPKSEFGDAKQYAQNFTGSRRFSDTQLIRGATLMVSIIALVTLRLTALRDVEFFPWGVLQGVAVFVIIGLAGDFIARRVNHRMPDGFHRRT